MNKDNQAGRILIMAGGTGGHVFPALAIAREFLNRGFEVFWLGTKQGIEATVVPNEGGIDICYLEISGVRGQGLKRLVLAPIKITNAILQAMKFIKKSNPDFVLGMGGFVTGPGGVAAKLSGKPLLVHEQNAIPGFTNKVLALMANRVMEAFPDSFKSNMFRTKNKVVTVGNPVRSDICSLIEPEQRFSARSGPLKLLILGGSQGAVALNQLIPETLALINAEDKNKDKPLVWHQVGKKNLENAQACYKTAGLDIDGIKNKVVAFIDDMAEAYAWADLVICRSGALTVSEIQQVGIGALLIPFPYAVDDHQTRNAEFLESVGGAVIAQQKDLTANKLQAIYEKLSSREVLLKMALASKNSAINNATNQVVAQCLEVSCAK